MEQKGWRAYPPTKVQMDRFPLCSTWLFPSGPLSKNLISAVERYRLSVSFSAYINVILNFSQTWINRISYNHMCLTAYPGWEWHNCGFFCSFAMLICVQYKNNRVGNFPWRDFWKEIDFSSTGKVVVMQILVSCIDSFCDSILLFYAKFPFIW